MSRKKLRRSHLQTVICVSAQGQDLYDWLEGYDLIQEAQDGVTAAPAEEPGQLSLYPPGDCTAWDEGVEGPIGESTRRQILGIGSLITVLVLCVMALIPLLNQLLGGGLCFLAGFGIMRGGYPTDYMINHLWLSLVLGLVVGAIVPELLSLLLARGLARRPEPQSRAEEQKQKLLRIAGLAALYPLATAPVWGLIVCVVFLPSLFPYQTSFLGSQWLLMFTGAYLLAAPISCYGVMWGQRPRGRGRAGV